MDTRADEKADGRSDGRMNYRECFEKGSTVLAKAGIEEAALDARLLLEFVCGTARHDLLSHGERLLTSGKRKIILT